MKTLKLSRGLEALIDAEDYERASQFKWHAEEVTDEIIYARRGYKTLPDGRLRHESLHAFIAQVPQDMVVRHVNGDMLDCRKANLKVAKKYEGRYRFVPLLEFRGRNYRPEAYPFIVIFQQSELKRIHGGTAAAGEQAPVTHIEELRQ